MVFCNKNGFILMYCLILVTILILIDGFLQYKVEFMEYYIPLVTILILIDGFLQCILYCCFLIIISVTILILIDGFLQYCYSDKMGYCEHCHNPYFNRWFSAIGLKWEEEAKIVKVTILILIDGFLQYR